MKAKDDFMLYLGNRIRKAREHAGFTQEELAALIGISRTAIARYESGDIEPKLRNLIAIADQLHVSCDYLLGRKVSDSYDLNLSDEALRSLHAFVHEIRITRGD